MDDWVEGNEKDERRENVTLKNLAYLELASGPLLCLHICRQLGVKVCDVGGDLLR